AGSPAILYTFNSGENTELILNISSIALLDFEITVFEESCSGIEIASYDYETSHYLTVLPNTNYVIRLSTASTYENDETFGICLAETFDCPELNANIGDTCDDNNSNTENDLLTADCECAGTIIVPPVGG